MHLKIQPCLNCWYTNHTIDQIIRYVLKLKKINVLNILIHSEAIGLVMIVKDCKENLKLLAYLKELVKL